MVRASSLRHTILQGRFCSNIDFGMLCRFMLQLGFSVRIKGDHHIFFKDGIDEIINLQPRRGKTKPYQVQQVRKIMIR